MADAAASVLTEEPFEGVLRLLLNRPERRNAVDRGVVAALLDAVEATDARALVLASSTAGTFCAGADIGLEDAERAEVSDLLYSLYERMVALPAPIVAAIDGHAVGAGAQLGIAADLRVGSPRASIRFPGPGHGLAVGAWGLPSLVGRGRALDLCLTMRAVDAAEALRIGLLDRVAEAPEHAALELAAGFAALEAGAVGRVKELVVETCRHPAALRAERRRNRQAWSGSLAGLAGEGRGG
jgi:enoyl-CoA hydratase